MVGHKNDFSCEFHFQNAPQNFSGDCHTFVVLQAPQYILVCQHNLHLNLKIMVKVVG